MERTYHARLQRVRRELAKCSGEAALVLGSAKEAHKSRDGTFPYRQNSNFYYLTGSHAPDCVLILYGDRRRSPVLLYPSPDPTRTLWQGAISVKKEARQIEASAVPYTDLSKELGARLSGVNTVFHGGAHTITWEYMVGLQERAPSPLHSLPTMFAHADNILEALRLRKQPIERRAIQEAIDVTVQALFETVQEIRPKIKEYEVAARVEHGFARHGASPAFTTIVASGSNAAVLHYEQLSAALRSPHMLLVDCGAQHHMYCADITRVFPVSGSFKDVHAAVYDTVLEAQRAAIAKIKPGVRIAEVYNAAAKVITEGLKDLGVLRGSTRRLFDEGAYRPYFPHGIGHGLGLDVHDIGPWRTTQNVTLEEGMVLTIEPGMYFPKKVNSIPACGVRIEDDILVTKHGCKVMTDLFPKTREDIEQLMAL